MYWLRPFFLCDLFFSTLTGAIPGDGVSVACEVGGNSAVIGCVVSVALTLVAVVAVLAVFPPPEIAVPFLFAAARAANGNSSEGSESVSP